MTTQIRAKTIREPPHPEGYPEEVRLELCNEPKEESGRGAPKAG